MCMGWEGAWDRPHGDSAASAESGYQGNEESRPVQTLHHVTVPRALATQSGHMLAWGPLLWGETRPPWVPSFHVDFTPCSQHWRPPPVGHLALRPVPLYKQTELCSVRTLSTISSSTRGPAAGPGEPRDTLELARREGAALGMSYKPRRHQEVSPELC